MTAATATESPVVLALHYQNDVLHPDGKIAMGIAKHADRRERLVKAAGTLIAMARDANVPVIFVRIAFRPDYRDVDTKVPMFDAVRQAGAMAEGSWGSAFYDGLGPREDEFVVTHNRINAFYATPLANLIDLVGGRTLYLGGVATNSVVEHTARHGADMGFRIVCVEDACASGRDDLHEAALENMRLLGACIGAGDVARHWAA